MAKRAENNSIRKTGEQAISPVITLKNWHAETILRLRCNPSRRGTTKVPGFQNQALDKLEQLLILNPNDVRALQNKAVIFERFNLIDEAVAIYDRILEIEPEKSTTLFNKSMCYLTKGWFKEGFNLYESRFNRETQLLSNYVGDEPVWTGKQSLQGKHLLVHPEQGLGDTILMSRFVNYIEDHGAKITFAVQKPLHSIM